MLIIVGGLPGSGKSILSQALRAHLRCPLIEFGSLREFHLEPDWSNQSEQEENMAFEHLVFILRSYLRHGYKHVLVTALKEAKIRGILQAFGKEEHLLMNLVADDSVIRQRIGSGTEGFTNVEAASAWNHWRNEV